MSEKNPDALAARGIEDFTDEALVAEFTRRFGAYRVEFSKGSRRSVAFMRDGVWESWAYDHGTEQHATALDAVRRAALLAKSHAACDVCTSHEAG